MAIKMRFTHFRMMTNPLHGAVNARIYLSREYFPEKETNPQTHPQEKRLPYSFIHEKTTTQITDSGEIFISMKTGYHRHFPIKATILSNHSQNTRLFRMFFEKHGPPEYMKENEYSNFSSFLF
jgi:hypothetical protein